MRPIAVFVAVLLLATAARAAEPGTEARTAPGPTPEARAEFLDDNPAIAAFLKEDRRCWNAPQAGTPDISRIQGAAWNATPEELQELYPGAEPFVVDGRTTNAAITRSFGGVVFRGTFSFEQPGFGWIGALRGVRFFNKNTLTESQASALVAELTLVISETYGKPATAIKPNASTLGGGIWCLDETEVRVVGVATQEPDYEENSNLVAIYFMPMVPPPVAQVVAERITQSTSKNLSTDPAIKAFEAGRLFRACTNGTASSTNVTGYQGTRWNMKPSEVRRVFPGIEMVVVGGRTVLGKSVEVLNGQQFDVLFKFDQTEFGRVDALREVLLTTRGGHLGAREVEALRAAIAKLLIFKYGQPHHIYDGHKETTPGMIWCLGNTELELIGRRFSQSADPSGWRWYVAITYKPTIPPASPGLRLEDAAKL